MSVIIKRYIHMLLHKKIKLFNVILLMGLYILTIRIIRTRLPNYSAPFIKLERKLDSGLDGRFG